MITRYLFIYSNVFLNAFWKLPELFPKQRILDSSKLKDFAVNNFKFDENGGKLSKRVGNTVGKGEIAHYK